MVFEGETVVELIACYSSLDDIINNSKASINRFKDPSFLRDTDNNSQLDRDVVSDSNSHNSHQVDLTLERIAKHQVVTHVNVSFPL